MYQQVVLTAALHYSLTTSLRRVTFSPCCHVQSPIPARHRKSHQIFKACNVFTVPSLFTLSFVFLAALGSNYEYFPMQTEGLQNYLRSKFCRQSLGSDYEYFLSPKGLMIVPMCMFLIRGVDGLQNYYAQSKIKKKALTSFQKDCTRILY